MLKYRIAGGLLALCSLPLLYFTFFDLPENRGWLRPVVMAFAVVTLWLGREYFRERES